VVAGADRFTPTGVEAACGTPKLTIPLLLSLMNKDSSIAGAGAGADAVR
jgi:hypothetical protein